jgi:hypothetical protein
MLRATAVPLKAKAMGTSFITSPLVAAAAGRRLTLERFFLRQRSVPLAITLTTLGRHGRLDRFTGTLRLLHVAIAWRLSRCIDHRCLPLW